MLPAVIRTDYSALPLYTYEGGFDPVRIACIFSKCYSLLEAPTSLKNALPPYSDHQNILLLPSSAKDLPSKRLATTFIGK